MKLCQVFIAQVLVKEGDRSHWIKKVEKDKLHELFEARVLQKW
jgi:hypothetical protein